MTPNSATPKFCDVKILRRRFDASQRGASRKEKNKAIPLVLLFLCAHVVIVLLFARKHVEWREDSKLMKIFFNFVLFFCLFSVRMEREGFVVE